jgi:hypothetical protein
MLLKQRQKVNIQLQDLGFGIVCGRKQNGISAVCSSPFDDIIVYKGFRTSRRKRSFVILHDVVLVYRNLARMSNEATGVAAFSMVVRLPRES